MRFAKVARVGAPGAERFLPLAGLVWSCSSAARYILTFAHPADPRSISVRDLETGLASVILSDPARNLYLADFSFDDRWVVFDAGERDNPAINGVSRSRASGSPLLQASRMSVTSPEPCLFNPECLGAAVGELYSDTFTSGLLHWEYQSQPLVAEVEKFAY